MVPRYAGSFVALTQIDKTNFPKRGLLVANPQLILAHKIPITQLQLASVHHPLEKYDFNSVLNSHPRGEQLRTTIIKIDKDGELNSIIGYIAVDFDMHHAERQSEQKPTGRTRTASSSFSSRVDDTPPTTNWPNPIIVLQQPIGVKKGDVIRIHTRTNTGTPSPSYTFTLEKGEENSRVWGPAQTINFNFQALYPTFSKNPSVPARNCSREENPLLHKMAAWTRQSQEEKGESTLLTPPNQTTIRRLECGVGGRTKGAPVGQRPPQKKDKQINIDIKLALTNRGKRVTPWNGTTMTQVINHLIREQTKLRDPNEPTPFFSPEIENVVAKHLHLDGTVNEHIANVRVGSRWHSLGACDGCIMRGPVSIFTRPHDMGPPP